MTAPTTAPATSGQLATFRLDGDLYGIEVEHVQEVLRSQQLTRVPLAPTAVAGLINLRGQVVTAIELRERLGRLPRPEGTDAVVIVVRLHGEAAVRSDIDDMGLLGSAVLGDKVTELLDVRAAILAADPAFYSVHPTSLHPSPAPSGVPDSLLEV